VNDDIVKLLTAALLVTASFITLAAAIGLFRLPDLFTRMHAASKAGSAGSGLALVAVAFHSGELGIWIKCLCAVSFFFLTAPLAAHLLAKAALAVGGSPHSQDNLDTKQ
jgi:multicomponent Na+:H+ antiporter subunit G